MERTRYETLADVDYAVRLFARHERLFGRLSRALKFATTCFALAPIAALLEKIPKEFGLAFAALGAVLSLVDLIWDPATTSCRHEHRRRDYQRLKATASQLPDEALFAQLETLRVDDPTVLESLKMPAYNELQLTLGHAQGRPLGRLEALLSSLS